MEPDWNDVQRRMMALTVKQLKPVRWWFGGCLGDAHTKAETVHEMAMQMRHWWNMPFGHGRDRVNNVLRDLKEAERLARL